MGHPLPCSTTDHAPEYCASAEGSIPFTWFDDGNIPRAGLAHTLAQCLPPLPSRKPPIQSEIWPHWGTFCTSQVIPKSRWVLGQAVGGGQHRRRGWCGAPPRPISDHLLLPPCRAKATTFLSSTGSRQAQISRSCLLAIVTCAWSEAAPKGTTRHAAGCERNAGSIWEEIPPTCVGLHKQPWQGLFCLPLKCWPCSTSGAFTYYRDGL